MRNYQNKTKGRMTMIPIKKMYTRVNRTKKRKKKNQYIVIHWVGAVSSAYNNARYFYSTYRGASANYFVDDKSIYQVVSDSDVAWHCGARKYYHPKCRNSNSIGIEMCLISKNRISQKTISNTAQLVQMLQKKYNIPDQNVIRHYDVTHKYCPGIYINGAKWSALKQQLVGKKVVQNKSKGAEKTYAKVIYTGNDKLGLAVRSVPDWKAKPVDYIKRKGEVYTVIKKVKVGNGAMYLLKSGLYITASTKYVKIYKK